MAFVRRTMRRPVRFRSRERRWIFLLVSVVVILFAIIYFIEHTIEPMLLAIAKTELKKAAQVAVSNGVKEIAHAQDVEKLLEIEKDKNGKVTMVKTNPKVQADLYHQVSTGVQKELTKLTDHRMNLSLGQLLQSPILSGYGPKIPIQLWPKGASKVSLIPKLQSAGINTVMVSLTLHVHSELGIIVPYSKDSTTVDITYPLGEIMMVGEVPEYYFYSDGGEVKAIPTLPAPAGKKGH